MHVGRSQQQQQGERQQQQQGERQQQQLKINGESFAAVFAQGGCSSPSYESLLSVALK